LNKPSTEPISSQPSEKLRKRSGSKKRFPRSLKYFFTLGLSLAILGYLGNSIFTAEKERVIQQHLLQAQLIAHLGSTTIAYAFDEIRNSQQLITSYLEHKPYWKLRDIKPLLSSFIKTNHGLTKWAGLSSLDGKIITHYPRDSIPPVNIKEIFANLPDEVKNAPVTEFLFENQLVLFAQEIKKSEKTRYIFWCIGSFEGFLHQFLSAYREFYCRHLWLVFKEGEKQKTLYMGSDFKPQGLETNFHLPFERKEIVFKGERLLAGAHPFKFGKWQGWFVVGIPRNRIEVQLAEFRYKGMLLTGFFIIFFSIFLYTYFKNRSRRIVAEQTANISREIIISKQQLESYIENATDGILRNDLDGKIRYVNPAFTRIFGWEAHEVIGKNILDLFPEDRDRLVKVMETIKAKKSFPPYETRRRRKDGQVIDLYVSASPILNSKGDVIAITAVYRDHTRLKRLEDRLYQSEKMAAIGQLVAQIAHEINNPLSTLQFSLQLLRRMGPKDEEFIEEIDDMEEEIKRIARIVDQLLSFSRPQSKRKRQASLKRVLRNKMIQLLFKNLRERGVEVEVNLVDPLPMVRVYSDQMLQVFINLIKNAADSIKEKGKITIVAETKVLDMDTMYQLPSRGQQASHPIGRVVEITISDTGEGIPPENLPHIFEPFFTSKGPEGTGLGLSVVHSIISRSNGTIEVESAPGKGTTFTIILPAIEPKQKRDKQGENMLKESGER